MHTWYGTAQATRHTHAAVISHQLFPGRHSFRGHIRHLAQQSRARCELRHAHHTVCRAYEDAMLRVRLTRPSAVLAIRAFWRVHVASPAIELM